MVRSSLLKNGIAIQSPEECFQDLVNNNFKDIIVLPTHIVAGKEYCKIVDCANKFISKFDSIKICQPLINIQDIPNIVDTILKVFNIPSKDFLLFMGHGNNTSSNEIYDLINKELYRRCIENMYMATLNDELNLDIILDRVRHYNPCNVIITPFMLVAGNHAMKNMIDWNSKFLTHGLNSKCLIKGLGEYIEFRKIYIQRIYEVIS